MFDVKTRARNLENVSILLYVISDSSKMDPNIIKTIQYCFKGFVVNLVKVHINEKNTFTHFIELLYYLIQVEYDTSSTLLVLSYDV